MPTTENKVRYGLKNVHLAACTITTDGSASFGSPVPFPGAVSLTADPDGSVEKFWADNMSYYSYNSESGYSGSSDCSASETSQRDRQPGFQYPWWIGA